MITHVHIKNYRSLENVSVDLGRLTVLVGRNGAGKSNFVDALQFVQEALLVGVDVALNNRGGFNSVSRWSAGAKSGELEIEIGIEHGVLSGAYGFVLTGGSGDEFRVSRETCRVGDSGNVTEEYEIRNGVWVTRPVKLSTAELWERAVPTPRRPIAEIDPRYLFLPSSRVFSGSLFPTVYGLLTDNNFYTLSPETLRVPQKFSTETRMGNHGENFASALRHIRQQAEDERTGTFGDLLAALRRVVDDVGDIRVNPVSSFLVTEIKHESAKPGDDHSPWFDLSQESDGTLRILALLTGLYQIDPSSGLLAVEEPEMGLHPGVLSVLAEVLQEASQRRQVLITTHSPDLISQFSADELRVVERTSGSTRIGPLTESQRETIEKQLFTTGDLLRIEGLHSSVEEAKAVHA